jgi:hypothetical protein
MQVESGCFWPASAGWSIGPGSFGGRAVSEQLLQMLLGPLIEAGHERVKVSVGADLGGVDEQFLAPDQACRSPQALGQSVAIKL